MNFLLDTHTLIWFITDDDELPINIKEKIENSSNLCFVSIASMWELGIKYSLGKLKLKVDLKKIFELIDQSGLVILPIMLKHILTNVSLDFYHRDPFDRIIIAQAKSDDLTLLSKDQEFKHYDIDLFWK